MDYPFHLQVGPHSYLYDVDISFNHNVELMYNSAFKKIFQEKLKSKKFLKILDDKYFDLKYINSISSKYLNMKKVRA